LLALPRVALGCGNFGGVGSSPDFFGRGVAEPDALELMDAAWAAGITHFDTADAYGGGRSETAIGKWIASRGNRPTVTTKTYNPMDHGADQGLAPDRIDRQLQSSLERLGLDHVELYLAHDYDPEIPLVETFGAFESHREAGRIGAYGVSNFNQEQLEAAVRAGDPQAVQNARSLLERADDQLVGWCAAHGIAYLAFGPLSGGWLAGRYRRNQAFPAGSRMTQRPGPYEHLVNDRTFDLLERFDEIARSRGQSPAGLALAWLLADGRVNQVVIGPTKPEHLDPLREALENPLTSEEFEALC
jgi:aryl-alcohol dehydrogenase-like predicted oxidoreductase